ncbi:MAG: HlyD family efflux transporter periplasmic adaptor subunit [Planctomycetaceae bacterium]|nr:HlyD family efflux transporter periplasmic adaptor subunit [Planctomycetaceae bacterium]
MLVPVPQLCTAWLARAVFRFRAVSLAMLAATVPVIAGGCNSSTAEDTPEPRPRPVTVIRLSHSDPSGESAITGTVSAWKRQEIGFQVPGRIDTILEPGLNIRGRTVDENGQLLTEGTVLATLESKRFELQVQSATAQLDTAIARTKAAETELKQVIPRQITVAEAQLRLAAAERERIRMLFERKAATQSDVDEQEARYATAEGQLAQQKANVEVKQAELESLRAQEREAGEQLRQAEKDLEDTRLISPFHGQIASVDRISGSFVQAGQQVLTIQMMDPVQVEVSLSAERDREIHYSDVVEVVLPGSEERVQAFVWLKDTVADSATRTFRLTLLVRNQQVEEGIPDDDSTAKLFRLKEAMQLFTASSRRLPPWFVNYQSLHQDEKGWFVWRLTGLRKEGDSEQPAGRETATPGRVTLEKVRVVPGEKRIPFLQVATFRELTDIGELNPLTDLIAGEFRTPDGESLDDLPAEMLAAGKIEVIYVRQQWQLRPGDYVQVQLSGRKLQPGLYVPVNSIISRGGKQLVQVVDSSGSVPVVRGVPVRADKTQFRDTLRRIEPVEAGSLKSGDRIVLDGAWFLSEGEAVSITEEVNP